MSKVATQPRKVSFPPYCTCGAPFKSSYGENSPYPWCSYVCGTDRAMKGTPPFPDSNRTVERSNMCLYAIDLRRTAGLTPSQAHKVWKKRFP